MNANKPSIPNQEIYPADKELIDTYHVVTEQMEWLSTLIHVAKTDKYHGQTLLNIAEYLADEWAFDHNDRLKQLEQN